MIIEGYILGLLDTILDLGIGILVIAIFVGIALTMFFTTNTTTWDVTTRTVWGYLPIMVIVALIIAVIMSVAYAAKRGKR